MKRRGRKKEERRIFNIFNLIDWMIQIHVFHSMQAWGGGGVGGGGGRLALVLIMGSKEINLDKLHHCLSYK